MTNVAVAQIGSLLFDTPASLDRMEKICAQAKQEQVEFLVFPEAFIGGYPKGADFGARIGSRTPEGRDDFRRYYESAITIPGQIGSALVQPTSVPISWQESSNASAARSPALLFM